MSFKSYFKVQELTRDEDFSVQKSAAKPLNFAVPHIPEMQKVWNDLIQLNSSEFYFYYFVYSSWGYAFSSNL